MLAKLLKIPATATTNVPAPLVESQEKAGNERRKIIRTLAACLWLRDAIPASFQKILKNYVLAQASDRNIHSPAVHHRVWCRNFWLSTHVFYYIVIHDIDSQRMKSFRPSARTRYSKCSSIDLPAIKNTLSLRSCLGRQHIIKLISEFVFLSFSPIYDHVR